MQYFKPGNTTKSPYFLSSGQISDTLDLSRAAVASTLDYLECAYLNTPADKDVEFLGVTLPQAQISHQVIKGTNNIAHFHICRDALPKIQEIMDIIKQGTQLDLKKINASKAEDVRIESGTAGKVREYLNSKHPELRSQEGYKPLRHALGGVVSKVLNRFYCRSATDTELSFTLRDRTATFPTTFHNKPTIRFFIETTEEDKLNINANVQQSVAPAMQDILNDVAKEISAEGRARRAAGKATASSALTSAKNDQKEKLTDAFDKAFEQQIAELKKKLKFDDAAARKYFEALKRETSQVVKVAVNRFSDAARENSQLLSTEVSINIPGPTRRNRQKFSVPSGSIEPFQNTYIIDPERFPVKAMLKAMFQGLGLIPVEVGRS